MNKKGAIEFSMTTIMVVIIGVAVLALGLTWIRGTFEGVGVITDEAIAGAETIVSELGTSGKIGVPASIILNSKEVKKFQVTVRNTDGDEGVFSIGDISELPDSECIEKTVISTTALTIQPGDSEKFIVAVNSNGDDSCIDGFSTTLKIPVKKGTDVWAEEGVTITVKR